MVQLIYASAATRPFSPDSLKTLLIKARGRNTLYKVSGMLLYHSGSFLQVLEGPDDSIDLILKSIFKDQRHNNTRTLSRNTIQSREFSSWSMGFTDLSLTMSRPEGHVDYVRALPALIDAATHAKRFLRFFQEGFYRQNIA